MPSFTITRHIDAPIESVWEVLDAFGEIERWNPGVTNSVQTSDGPVGIGTTRHCDFAPFGSVEERIDHHAPHERMTVAIHETSKLPISHATADFVVDRKDGGTELTLHYSYEPNLLGRLTKRYTATKMEKGIGGMAAALERESERLAAL